MVPQVTRMSPILVSARRREPAVAMEPRAGNGAVDRTRYRKGVIRGATGFEVDRTVSMLPWPHRNPIETRNSPGLLRVSC